MPDAFNIDQGRIRRRFAENNNCIGDPLPTREERDVFAFLTCGWIEPEDR